MLWYGANAQGLRVSAGGLPHRGQCGSERPPEGLVVGLLIWFLSLDDGRNLVDLVHQYILMSRHTVSVQ